ncbi:pancreatic lipase-related protein 2-like [Culicoides brevitarsis]|uniref:pancreatic lipase-related protein 2-like n=1 Tax=Culicoides brevitarsis TaxID=469753 RepID=UPI00307B8AA3
MKLKILIFSVFLTGILNISAENFLKLTDFHLLRDISELETLAKHVKNDIEEKFRPLCADSVIHFHGRSDVKFILYNKKYPFGVDVSKNFKLIPKNEEIRFIIHGFLNGGNGEMPQTVKNAFMKLAKPVNSVIVDWSKGSGTWLSNYFVCLITSRVVPMVGEAVGEFIVDLIRTQTVKIGDVNVIGHSLGAQIAGFAGKYLSFRGLKLPVIVGLDPALPGFKNSKEKLSSSDADYVEVIHTNSGELGFRVPMGTADFYPNFHKGLSRMPGCVTASCSHAMSFKYFAASVLDPNAFKAYKCESYDELKKAGKCNGTEISYLGGDEFGQRKPGGVFFLKINKIN